MKKNNSTGLIEIPSGKNKRYENFPVASYVLSKSIRPHINTFYSFSRTIDDIADSNTINAKEKIDRLSGFENAIIGKDTTSTEFEKAHNMRRSLEETGVTEQHCIDLIQAFKQDATKLRYQNWDELIGYCQLSAAPVGRYLLDLHGESTQVYTKSDALCNALQILNHLQDCKQDYLTLNRVYLPIVWLAEKGLEVNCLNAARSVPELKEVFLKILNSTEDLLQIANKLPRVITNKRLAIESNSILHIAFGLTRKLRMRDPLSERIRLSKWQYIQCCTVGILKTLLV